MSLKAAEKDAADNRQRLGETERERDEAVAALSSLQVRERRLR